VQSPTLSRSANRCALFLADANSFSSRVRTENRCALFLADANSFSSRVRTENRCALFLADANWQILAADPKTGSHFSGGQKRGLIGRAGEMGRVDGVRPGAAGE
jgi:hypothetical protein